MKTLEQVRVVSGKDRALLGEVKKVIQGSLPTAEVLLYGSIAKGTQRSESDYDILVLTEEPLSTKAEDSIRDALYELQLRKGVLLSTMFYSKGFWEKHPNMPFHREVDKDAIML